jgi:hypothetical protein
VIQSSRPSRAPGVKSQAIRSRLWPSASWLEKSRARFPRVRSGVTKATIVGKTPRASAASVAGQCLCGTVQIEIDFPARWAWHDHSSATRRAHGSAYATYIGSWRRRFRVTKGRAKITRFQDEATGTARSFCARCGTPLTYERARSAHMVNIPRALFTNRTGREPRYHIAIQELQDWTYLGEPLLPLNGFPGVVWERPTRKKRREITGPF